MTIDINELRMLTQDFKLAGSPMFLQTTQMNELLDRLEAAEKSDAESIAMYRKARDERDALRAELTDLRNSMTFRTSLIGRIEAEREDLHALIAAVKKQVNAEFRLRMKKEIECNALRAEVEAMKRPTPSVSDSWPIYADPFAYVIQHLNSNPYPLTKDETITFIKELRALYNAATEAKP